MTITQHQLPECDTRELEAAVDIRYYTDPLCSWSWALEPEWRRLRYEFAGLLSWRYVMGGMIADWQSFADPLNDISRPSQMGPHWLQVRQIAGVPIDERIWHADPPASSYPACIAVKAAERQGSLIGELYLRRLRESVMAERRNIARSDVLLALADELAADRAGGAGFDAERFRRDLAGQESIDAFRADLQDTRYRGIGRFPTLIVRSRAGQAVLIVGYRPYAALRAALARVAPTLEPVRSAPNAAIYTAHWGRVTAREVGEACGLAAPAAAQALDQAVAEGAIVQAGYAYAAAYLYEADQ